jgi:hypothetical protein
MGGKNILVITVLVGLFGVSLAVAQSGAVEVGTFTTKHPYSAVVYNDYLYIADDDALLVYNISLPDVPVKVGEFTDFSYPRKIRGVSISDDGELYVAGGPAWIYVFDISNPVKPKKLYQLTYWNNARDVAVSGNFMYVADANVGVLVFDLTNKTKPEEVGRFYILKSNISGSLSGWGGIAIAASGDKVYAVGDQRQGFFILDVRNKTKPVQTYRTTVKSAYDVAALDDVVYVVMADGTPSVLVLDVTNPYKPQTLYSFHLEGTAEQTAIAVHPRGEYLYVAADDTWHIFKFDKTPPVITINTPVEEVLTDETVVISGTAVDESGVKEVLVNGEPAGNNSWSYQITLTPGVNKILISATDLRGNTQTEEFTVIYQPPTSTPEPAAAKTSNETPVSTETVPDTGVSEEKVQPGFFGVIALMALVLWVLGKRSGG